MDRVRDWQTTIEDVARTDSSGSSNSASEQGSNEGTSSNGSTIVVTDRIPIVHAPRPPTSQHQRTLLPASTAPPRDLARPTPSSFVRPTVGRPLPPPPPPAPAPRYQKQDNHQRTPAYNHQHQQRPPPHNVFAGSSKFATSASDFRIARPAVGARNPVASTSTTNQNGSSVKARIMGSIVADRQKMGIPLSVPQNPPYQRPVQHPSLSDPARGIDRDDYDYGILSGPLPNMGFENGLNGQDPETALKELFAGTPDNDFENLDPNLVAPPGLTISLHPYQLQGCHWLASREAGKKRGGMLCDGMGLGKTVQMIALMLSNPPAGKVKNAEGKKCKTTLIVCPLALMQQWKDEIKTKSSVGLTVLIHHGADKKNARQLSHYDVVITSYNTLQNEWPNPKKFQSRKAKGKGKQNSLLPEAASDNESDSTQSAPVGGGALFDVEFYRIILDEAHTIKNRNTGTHKSCCALRGHYRWCLTGTPIQNDLYDLYALFAFLGKIVNPLHDFAEFKSKIADPFKNNQSQVALTRLAVTRKAIMLRRTKDSRINGKLIVTLPKREIREVKINFHEKDEADFYKAVVEKMELRMNAFVDAGTVMSNYTSVLTLLLRMRQACSHPALVTGNKVDEAEAIDINVDPNKATAIGVTDDETGLVNLLGGLSVETRTCAMCPRPSRSKDDGFCRKCHDDLAHYQNLKFSTKVRQTMRILEEIRKENPSRKTIVFSQVGRAMFLYNPGSLLMLADPLVRQFTTMFDILEPFLKMAKLKYVRFDGRMNAVQKNEALKTIRTDPATTIILISIKCGSVGLNLTCCSRVVLLDLWWNPAIEEQAFDRAHRIGQTEEVVIFKITINETVEDRILTLQKQKAELAAAALDGGNPAKAAKLSMKDILFLFRGSGKGSGDRR
ncbi:BZ3500_MvSof-1268-A1-R1_Chr2-3g05205 [Microbotryum saponariae]|uniref:BZ3500_MvSof-1268-A1-R1_Chr2-3g05205 protein n=1 Tax=Microbotryum saponariae TaxID=289078 RepID=A0A2X0L376_9BASI|nr:BZ3500_MvSof-1268-A1-R1_Chr2-3g05205 [Microbotryum saponariae]SDA01031.1 BZ3501_MvSof-1269-A2-R1_Chr2-2g04878 [Microbotryum saponariae]